MTNCLTSADKRFTVLHSAFQGNRLRHRFALCDGKTWWRWTVSTTTPDAAEMFALYVIAGATDGVMPTTARLRAVVKPLCGNIARVGRVAQEPISRDEWHEIESQMQEVRV